MNEKKIYSPCGPDCRRFAHEGGASCVVLDDGLVAGPVRARDHIGNRWPLGSVVDPAGPVAGDRAGVGVGVRDRARLRELGRQQSVEGPVKERRLWGRLVDASARVDDWIDGLTR